MEPLSPEPHGLSPGDVIAGKFRLERVIGRGGMGSVWAARHVQLDMPVALKFIEAEGDAADARARFEREARAAGQIRSPHVVQIIDHGIDTGGRDQPYIAMELLEGEDLGERLRRERRLSVPAVARILTQAAKALRRAHEAGIIHRDLKPGNVFLARFDDDEVVKLLDFGVAKMRRAGVLEENLATQVGVVFGSPSYMSPEQARGARAVDHRSDLWSLAVIVFRAVTGVKPFQAASIADLVIKLCIDPLPVATRFAPDLPPGIDGFFERAFARDPDQRFASAPEMAAAFEAVAAGASPAVAPSSSLDAAPPSALPIGGSGPHVAFAPGTLTPPPAPGAAPFHPPSFVPAPIAMGAITPPLLGEPTPGSGVSSFPSGGWPLPPPSATSLSTSAASPGPSPAGLAGGARERPPAAPTPAPSRAPLVLAASIGGGLLVLLVLAMVARQGSSSAASASASAASHDEGAPQPPPPPSAIPSPATPPPIAAATAEPAPVATVAATAEPEPTAGASAGSTGSAAAPAEPVPPSGTATPRGPARSGKKKKPNFGY